MVRVCFGRVVAISRELGFWGRGWGCVEFIICLGFGLVKNYSLFSKIVSAALLSLWIWVYGFCGVVFIWVLWWERAGLISRCNWEASHICDCANELFWVFHVSVARGEPISSFSFFLILFYRYGSDLRVWIRVSIVLVNLGVFVCMIRAALWAWLIVKNNWLHVFLHSGSCYESRFLCTYLQLWNWDVTHLLHC